VVQGTRLGGESQRVTSMRNSFRIIKEANSGIRSRQAWKTWTREERKTSTRQGKADSLRPGKSAPITKEEREEKLPQTCPVSSKTAPSAQVVKGKERLDSNRVVS